MKKRRRPTPSELKKQRFETLINDFQENIINSIIGTFGLSKSMFNDKDGGNVTTLHNFQNGINANDKDTIKYKNWKKTCDKPIDRSDYDSDKNKIRKSHFKSNSEIHDSLTGKKLDKNGSAQLDHTRSIKSIETDPKYNLYFDKKDRVKVANDHHNLKFTHSRINQSKQDLKLNDWANKTKKGQSNIDRFELDKQKITSVQKESDNFHSKEIIKARISKDSKELASTSLNQAGRNGLRHALGFIFKELAVSLIFEIKDLQSNGLKNNNLADTLSEKFNNVLINVTAKKNEIVESFQLGAIDGVISNLVTYVINNFITTSKKIVRVVRDNFGEMLRAIKLMLFPPNDMSQNDAFREGIKIITTSIINSLAIILENQINDFVKTTVVLAFMAEELSSIIMGILTGLSTSLAIYTIDIILDSVENPYSLHHLENLISNNKLQLELLDSSLEKFKIDSLILNNCDLTQTNESTIQRENLIFQENLSQTSTELDSYSSLLQSRLEILKKLKKGA